MDDKQAVTELLHKAGWAYDTAHVDFLVEMFTEDGEFDLQVQTNEVLNFAGRTNIRALYENALASQGDQRRHIISNLFFSDEKQDAMTATSNIMLIAVTKDSLQVVSTGVYTDKLVKEHGRWHIQHRFEYLDLPF